MMKKILVGLAAASIILCVAYLFYEHGQEDEAYHVSSQEHKEDKGEADTSDLAPVTLKIMLFGQEPLYFDEVLEVFYRETRDSLNVTLDIEFREVDDHMQKLLMVAAAGLDYDLVFDAPWMHLDSLSQEGAYQSLNQYFGNSDYPGLYDNFDPPFLDSNRFFGEIYGIPLTPTVASSEALGIRKDLMDKYGFEEILTEEDLKAFMDTILANEPDMVPLAVEGRNGFYRLLQPDYASFNIFPVGDFLVALSEDNTKVLGATYTTGSYVYGGDMEEVFEGFPAPWNELDTWYERPLTYKEWRKYLEDDVMTQTEPEALFESGKAAILSRGYDDVSALKNLNEILDVETDLYTFPYMAYDRLRVEHGHYTDYKAWNFLCIPSSSSKQDRTMAFMDWVFQSEDNNNLFNFGIEGVHWEAVGDDLIHLSDDLDEPYYFPSILLTATPNMIRYDEELPSSAVDFLKWQSNPDKYALSPLTGFNMDYEAIKLQQITIDAIYNTKSIGIINGSYDNPIEILQNLNAEAREVGLEDLRAEVIRQVQAFLDARQ